LKARNYDEIRKQIAEATARLDKAIEAEKRARANEDQIRHMQHELRSAECEVENARNALLKLLGLDTAHHPDVARDF